MRTGVHLSSLRTVFYNLSNAICAKAAVIAFAIASTCSIICGCDPAQICLAEGGAFGPCIADAEAPAGCMDGFTCIDVKEGRICVPVAEIGGLDEVQKCASQIGELTCSDALGLCLLYCDPKIPDACGSGAVCDDRHGICVHRYEPATEPRAATSCQGKGTLFGPCYDNECSGGALCFTAMAGDMCVPPAETAERYTCNGLEDEMTCDSALGFCYLSCEDAPCAAGTVCDNWTKICVFSS